MRAMLLVLLVTSSVSASGFAEMQAKLDALAKPEPKVEAKPKLRRYYNIYRTKPNWSYPWRGNEKQGLIHHLMTAPAHGKFDRKKLEGLSLKSLRKLHSNDHDDVPFFWSYNGLNPAKKQAIKQPAYCPT